MPAATLRSMANRACVRDIALLDSVGEVEYNLVRPILKKVENPQQLRTIEINSPHIADHDAELWKAFIVRDIPDWENKIMEPKNPRSWWKVYRKLIKEERRAKEEQEEQLLATLTGIDKKKEANQAQIVQKVIPQQTRGQAFAYGVRRTDVNSWGQQRTPALQNAKKGKDILSAIRKQVSNAQQQKGRTSIQPASALLPNARSQITKAPAFMVRDHAKPQSFAAMKQQARANGEASRPTPPPAAFVSRNAPSAQDKAIKEALRSEQAKKEERLRALANGSKASPVAALPTPPTSQPMASSSSSELSLQARSQAPPKPARHGSPIPPAPRLAVSGEIKRTLSPSPAPVVRKRPAQPVSIFMPSKKRKV